MTDKELRRLKRTDLLEILFYMRDELDNVKKENESLKSRIDNLSKAAVDSKTELSEESVARIANAVVNIINTNASNSPDTETTDKDKKQD